MDYMVHGILQARILEWVAFPFSRELPNTGIEHRFPALQVDYLPVFLKRMVERERVKESDRNRKKISEPLAEG